jgi:hypothetical protein
VRSEGGEVDLELRPFGEWRSETNLGLVAARLGHVAGTFHGRVCDAEGRRGELEGVTGLVETNESRW